MSIIAKRLDMFKNCFSLVASFTPGDVSTPLLTSTANGRTVSTAERIFDGFNPPENDRLLPAERCCELPVEGASGAAVLCWVMRIQQNGIRFVAAVWRCVCPIRFRQRRLPALSVNH
ncbi:MAG: hypothetical protein R3C26_15305 [Calditrichia bacterium]